jgi:hypothetical protein
MTDAAPRFWRPTFVAAGVCVVAAGAAVSVAIWKQRPQLAPIEVSQQTTYIDTPTRADGWVDYPEAVDWMRRASLDAGGANAALPLLRALGREVLPPRVDRSALLQRLNIAAGDEAGVLKPLAKFSGADAGGPAPPAATMEWLRAHCRDAEKKELPFARVVAWLAASEAALAELRLASQSAGLYVPVSRGPRAAASFDRVNVRVIGDAADALACHAAVKLLQGDTGASWADVDALWRLGQLLARGASTGEYTAALELWRRALTGTVDLAASPATSPELLSAVQARLSAKLGFSPATETWMFHRLAMLEASGTPQIAPPQPDKPAGGLLARVGTGAMLAAINREFDTVDAALQAREPRQRIAGVDKLAVGTAGQIGVTARSLLGAEIQAISSQRLASIAVALARRQRDGGKLPASLAELGDLPKDPATGASFSYTPDGRGFRVHGAGADGRDDGGDAARDAVALAREPPRLAPP